MATAVEAVVEAVVEAMVVAVGGWGVSSVLEDAVLHHGVDAVGHAHVGVGGVLGALLLEHREPDEPLEELGKHLSRYRAPECEECS